MHQVSGEYVAGSGPFRERLPEVVIGGRFLYELATMYRAYAGWAERFLTDGRDEGSALSELAALHDVTA